VRDFISVVPFFAC